MNAKLHSKFVRSLSAYDSAYELLEAETILPEMGEDFLSYLRTFDAFEAVRYFCINHEIVIFTDSVSNDTIWTCYLSDVLPDVRKQYEQENGDGQEIRLD